MPVHVGEALVLRTYRYGEADRIVVFLTADRGKKRGVAKNATASRRRFGGGLEPLTRGRVSYMEREHRELVRLDRIEPAASPLAASWGRASASDGASLLAHASYFAELLDEWAPDGSPNERLFRLGAAVGDALGAASTIDALARYFEYWLLRLEGVYPAIEACPVCAAAFGAAGAVLVPRERQYVCAACAAHGPYLSPEAFAFLRRAARTTPAAMSTADAAREPLRELEQAHLQLIAMHLDKDLRSPRVVQEVRPHS